MDTLENHVAFLQREQRKLLIALENYLDGEKKGYATPEKLLNYVVGIMIKDHDSRDFRVMSKGNPVPVKPAKPPKSKIKVIKEPKPKKKPAKKTTKRKVKP